MLNLPTRIRHSAVFLVQPDYAEKPLPQATAFIVSVPGQEDQGHTYLVTARHCLYQADKDIPLKVRLNLKSGGFSDIRIPHIDEWFYHDDTDVAILPFDLPEESIAMHLPVSMLITNESKMNQKEGEQVAFVSLFSLHPGVEKMLPILRTGTISLLPYELVTIANGNGTYTAVDAYLIESLSWGGCSGAPTFVSCRNSEDSFKLIGLVNGHKQMYQDLDHDGSSLRFPINAGIAIVIPSGYIIDLINREDVVDERMQHSEVTLKHELISAPVDRVIKSNKPS